MRRATQWIFVPLAMTAVFLVANRMALNLNRDAMRANVARTITANPAAFAETPTEYADCELLIMAVDSETSLGWQTAMAPRHLWDLHRPEQPCDGLRELSTTGSVNPRRWLWEPFYQYWWGPRVIIAALLRLMDIRSMRLLIGALLIGMAMLATVLWARRRNLAMSVISGALLMFCFAPTAGSLMKFSSDLVLASFLCWCAVRTPGPVAFSIFGAITGYFELLDGAIPLSLALIAALASFRREWAFEWGREAVAAFLAGLLVPIAARLAIVLAFIDPQYLGKFTNLLMYRLTGAARPVPAAMRDLFSVEHVSYGREIAGLWKMRWMLGFGRAVGTVLILLAAAGLLAGLASTLRSPEKHGAFAGLLLSSAPIVLWMALFREHTYAHAVFMVRVLAWPVGCGLAMAAVLIEARMRRVKIRHVRV